MKSSFCTILLLLCLGLAHGTRDNYGFDYPNNDYCVYEYLSMKPDTVMTTNTCMQLTCDHNKKMIIATCPTLTCNKGEKIVHLPSQNDDSFPQCCPKIICRRRESGIN